MYKGNKSIKHNFPIRTVLLATTVLAGVSLTQNTSKAHADQVSSDNVNTSVQINKGIKSTQTQSEVPQEKDLSTSVNKKTPVNETTAEPTEHINEINESIEEPLQGSVNTNTVSSTQNKDNTTSQSNASNNSKDLKENNSNDQDNTAKQDVQNSNQTKKWKVLIK